MASPGLLSHEDDVIVTSVVAYGESDAIVRLFASKLGRIGAFARGARKSRRRFPSLSAPGLGRAVWRARRGADLFDLAELEMSPIVHGFSASLRALGHAAYVAELVERLVPEGDPAPLVFAHARRALEQTAAVGPTTITLRTFELRLLAELGHLPDLHRIDPPGDVAGYDAAQGLLVSRTGPGVQPFDEAARRAAIALLLTSAPPELDAGVLRGVGRIFASYLRGVGGAPLRSVRFLAEIDDDLAAVAGRPPLR